MATVLIYPALALATTAAGAAAYVWYQKPSVAIRLLIKIGMKRAGLTLHYVDLKGGERMCYAERGVAVPVQPSMVFVHGFSAAKDSWLSILKILPRDIHVVLVDLLGHGDSSPPGAGHAPSIEYLTETLHELLKKEGIVERPVHLVGISMGGLIGCMYTAFYPQHVHMLTAVCPVVYIPNTSEAIKRMREANKNYLLPESIEDIQEMFNLIVYDKSKIPRSTQMLKGVLQMKKGSWDFLSELSTYITASRVEEKSAELMSRIQRPVQILWGVDDDLLDVSGAEFMKSRLSDCRRVDLVERCGHAMTWDQPRRVTKSILEFRAAILSEEEQGKKAD